MKRVTESQVNILSALAQSGAAALDQFWLLPCVNLKKTGLVSIYGRTVRAYDEKPGKAFICLTPLGWETAEHLGLFAPLKDAPRNKIAYSPYYQGLMIWRPNEGCSSFHEREFESEASARAQLQIEAARLDAEIVPAGSLDGWAS